MSVTDEDLKKSFAQFDSSLKGANGGMSPLETKLRAELKDARDEVKEVIDHAILGPLYLGTMKLERELGKSTALNFKLTEDIKKLNVDADYLQRRLREVEERSVEHRKEHVEALNEIASLRAQVQKQRKQLRSLRSDLKASKAKALK